MANAWSAPGRRTFVPATAVLVMTLLLREPFRSPAAPRDGLARALMDRRSARQRCDRWGAEAVPWTLGSMVPHSARLYVPGRLRLR